MSTKHTTSIFKARRSEYTDIPIFQTLLTEENNKVTFQEQKIDQLLYVKVSLFLKHLFYKIYSVVVIDALLYINVAFLIQRAQSTFRKCSRTNQTIRARRWLCLFQRCPDTHSSLRCQLGRSPPAISPRQFFLSR